MALPWARMDTQWPHNPKFLILAEDKKWRAIAVFWGSVGWSVAQSQAGFVPAYVLPMIHGTRKEAHELVEVGLWEMAQGGWQVHDFADYQLSNEANEKRSDRARKAAQERWARRQQTYGDAPSTAQSSANGHARSIANGKAGGNART